LHEEAGQQGPVQAPPDEELLLELELVVVDVLPELELLDVVLPVSPPPPVEVPAAPPVFAVVTSPPQAASPLATNAEPRIHRIVTFSASRCEVKEPRDVEPRPKPSSPAGALTPLGSRACLALKPLGKRAASP